MLGIQTAMVITEAASFIGQSIGNHSIPFALTGLLADVSTQSSGL
jgi:hypothetical protein